MEGFSTPIIKNREKAELWKIEYSYAAVHTAITLFLRRLCSQPLIFPIRPVGT